MSSASAPPATAGYRRYALVLLMLVYMINFVDRQILNILAEPIKHEFGLADWQLGVMTGLAFAVFYTLLGVPIARYAEHGHRPRIIAVAIATWSACTALCGLSTSFLQLVLARVGVGVGEAGCSPPAHSLISDYVPKERRASAFALYQLGAPLGTLIGLALGGIVAGLVGWRAAFLIVGLPGVAFALVAALTLREPRSRSATAARQRQADLPSFRQALAFLVTKRTYWLVCTAAALKGMIGYGQGAFVASFFLRNHGDALGRFSEQAGLPPIGLLGLVLGVATGIGGLIGALIGGGVTDRLARRDVRAYVDIPAVAALIVAPVYVAVVTVPDLRWAIVFFFVNCIANTVWYGPLYAVCQGVVPANIRATSSAIQLFIANLVGLSLGPMGVGLLSDLFADAGGLGPAEGVRWALVCSSAVGLVACALYWRSRRWLAGEMED